MLGLMACVPRQFCRGFTERKGCPQNEQEVGDAIKESGVPREDIFATLKVCNPPELDFLND